MYISQELILYVGATLVIFGPSVVMHFLEKSPRLIAGPGRASNPHPDINN